VVYFIISGITNLSLFKVMHLSLCVELSQMKFILNGDTFIISSALTLLNEYATKLPSQNLWCVWSNKVKVTIRYSKLICYGLYF